MSSPATATKRLLVTGGRGRLAALIADHFRAPAHQVTLFSRQAGGQFRDLAELTSAGALTGADVLLHLGWSTLPATAEQAAATDDLPLICNLLDVLERLPAERRPHLVFFSSGGTVYGNAGAHPCRESDPCRPIGRYGRDKLAAEQLLQARAASGNLACTILRISNPYGYPVPSGRVQGVIPHAIRCAVEGRPLTLWGEGDARKDFLYYTDFLAAIEAVIAARLTGTFNVCAGESHSVREVIALVEQHTGRPVTKVHTPAAGWDVQDSRLDNSRLVAATGWRPQVTLGEGIQRAVAAYLQH